LFVSERAFAKINLYFDVLGRHPDGYHEVRTVLQEIDLYDVLLLESATGVSVECPHPCVPTGRDNLVHRAAELLLKRVGPGAPEGVAITLEKRIPIGAGLGGGSSDAAATLRGVNDLYGLGCSIDELVYLGRELGADVPFCVRGGAAVGRGRGDEIEPCAPLPPCRVVLAKPSGVEMTGQAYERVGKSAAGPGPGELLKGLESGDLEAVCRALFNVFEPDLVRRRPDVGALKRAALEAGALGAGVTGSGPTVYALAESEETADRVAAAMRVVAPWVVKAGCRSPNGSGEVAARTEGGEASTCK